MLNDIIIGAQNRPQPGKASPVVASPPNASTNVPRTTSMSTAKPPISNPNSPAPISSSPRTPNSFNASPKPTLEIDENKFANTIISKNNQQDGGQTIVGSYQNQAAKNNQQTIVGGIQSKNQQTIVGNIQQKGQQTIVGGSYGMYGGGQTIVGNSALAGMNATLIGGGILRESGNDTIVETTPSIAPQGRMVSQAPLMILRMIPDTPDVPPFERIVTHNVVKVGRAPAPEAISPDQFIAFATKVVSRMHAEFWSSNGEVKQSK